MCSDKCVNYTGESFHNNTYFEFHDTQFHYLIILLVNDVSIKLKKKKREMGVCSQPLSQTLNEVFFFIIKSKISFPKP